MHEHYDYSKHASFEATRQACFEVIELPALYRPDFAEDQWGLPVKAVPDKKVLCRVDQETGDLSYLATVGIRYKVIPNADILQTVEARMIEHFGPEYFNGDEENSVKIKVTLSKNGAHTFVEYTFPAGMALHVLSQSAISTDISQLNDPVEAITDQNLYLYEELVIPKNTRVLGIVSRIEPPVQGRDGILAIRFTEVILDNGERLPISAHVRTEHPEQIWGGKVTQGTKPVLSTQRVWGIGEYNRIVFAGPRAMGKDITLPPGDHWTISLDQPLTLVKAKDEEEY